MKLTDLRDALNTLPVPFHHFHATKQSYPYGIWLETGQASAEYADGVMTLQVIEGEIEYHTKKEFDPMFNQIQEVLNDIGPSFSWELAGISYTEANGTNGFISYYWNWKMVCGVGNA